MARRSNNPYKRYEPKPPKAPAPAKVRPPHTKDRAGEPVKVWDALLGDTPGIHQEITDPVPPMPFEAQVPAMGNDSDVGMVGVSPFGVVAEADAQPDIAPGHAYEPPADPAADPAAGFEGTMEIDAPALAFPNPDAWINSATEPPTPNLAAPPAEPTTPAVEPGVAGVGDSVAEPAPQSLIDIADAFLAAEPGKLPDHLDDMVQRISDQPAARSEADQVKDQTRAQRQAEHADRQQAAQAEQSRARAQGRAAESETRRDRIEQTRSPARREQLLAREDARDERLGVESEPTAPASEQPQAQTESGEQDAGGEQSAGDSELISALRELIDVNRAQLEKLDELKEAIEKLPDAIAELSQDGETYP